jgi:TonB family protein
VSFRVLKNWLAMGLLLLGGGIAVWSPAAWGQEEISRKSKIKVQPAYPELARRMNITGVVKMQVTVATNGTVKSWKVVGGHPVLVNAAIDAIKKWKFEPAAEESTGIVEFRFDPGQ